MWEAIIGILGSLASTMLNKYQNDASLKRMNEYNSPKSQLARYSEAGLSPANVYSQGAGSGTQNLIGNYQTSLGSDIVSSVMGASQLKQQKQLQQHQLQLIDAQANNQNAEAALKLLEADWLPEEKKAQIANVIADTLLKGSQKSNVEAQTVSESYKQFLMDAQGKEALSKVGVNDQTIRTLIAQEEHFWALVDNVSSDTANIKPAMKTLLEKQADYYDNAAKQALAQANFTDEQRRWYYSEVVSRIATNTASSYKARKDANLADVMADVQSAIKDELKARADLTDEQRTTAEMLGPIQVFNQIIKSIPGIGLLVK